VALLGIGGGGFVFFGGRDWRGGEVNSK